MAKKSIWFLAGSQNLYGEDVLLQVEQQARTIAAGLADDPLLPLDLVFVPVVKTQLEITSMIQKANSDDNCLGIITWMHTFSPAKMWLAGLALLQKPLLHLNTQFNREIPWETIDMDFMNLNQSAHGDREYGFALTRLRLARKIVVGYWQDEPVKARIRSWARALLGKAASANLKIARFGDNMRDVAVTEGDKVEAQLRLGWSVNGYGLGDLAPYLNAVKESDLADKLAQYRLTYQMPQDNLAAVAYQARLELGLAAFLEEGGFGGFTTTFENLAGLEQLPGLAVQNLMARGYGFGAEGDWKTAGLLRVMKEMSRGLAGGNSFMEDYTYHLVLGQEQVLGAHMLEVCPSIAGDRPAIQVHELGIGGKAAPARLVFTGRTGPAILATLVDLGDRLRLIVNEVLAAAPAKSMPRLPVAAVMWQPLPDLYRATESWLTAGGAHHSVLSYDLNIEQMRDLARIFNLELVHIGPQTDPADLAERLALDDVLWRLKN